MSELLTVQGLTAGYADSVVLEDIDLLVFAGESTSLLGRNGMGKTTLLTSVMGLTRLHKGTIRLDGREITHVPTHRRSRLGVGWVPQERLTFASLTVHEHITAVARPGYWNVKTIFDALPSLEAKKSNRGKELSGGEQQMLAIARALATNPRLLLLDEPLEGLAPIVAQEILRVLKRLVGQEGLSMILVEQHAKEALAITDKAIVLERGRIAYSGSSAKLIEDDALLGGLLALVST